MGNCMGKGLQSAAKSNGQVECCLCGENKRAIQVWKTHCGKYICRKATNACPGSQNNVEAFINNKGMCVYCYEQLGAGDARGHLNDHKLKEGIYPPWLRHAFHQASHRYDATKKKNEEALVEHNRSDIEEAKQRLRWAGLSQCPRCGDYSGGWSASCDMITCNHCEFLFNALDWTWKDSGGATNLLQLCDELDRLRPEPAANWPTVIGKIASVHPIAWELLQFDELVKRFRIASTDQAKRDVLDLLTGERFQSLQRYLGAQIQTPTRLADGSTCM
jgi:hypothetical protein